MIIKSIVVDDEPMIRTMLESALALMGIEVIAEGQNGFEAFDLYVKHRPHIVLIDFRMPALSGLEAARMIRQLDATARILLISGILCYENLTPDEQRTYGLLNKPFSLGELRKAVEKTLQYPLEHVIGREKNVA